MSPDPAAIFERWQRIHPGSAIGELRYRWPLTHKRVRPLPPWAEAPDTWKPWQEAETTGDPFELEARLSVPAIVCDAGELLSADTTNSVASNLLSEALPVMRREFASFVRGQHAWSDTFALWCLARSPRMLPALQPFALAIAATYAAAAASTGGVVLGTRYPFHEVPLASASAHLGAGLWAIGQELELIAALASYLRGAMRASGGFGDGSGREDLLTTLAAADFLTHVDPSFDPAPVRNYFAAEQAAEGWWRAFGPEVPWLTAAIAKYLAAAELPFSARFRWPHLPAGNRDHKTRLPFFAWFDQLARLFSALPGLAASPVEVAFIDLAGFRAFNNSFGQSTGDEVLAEFADSLSSLSAASAIRDGGDEFLVVGAPGRPALDADLDTLRRAWPAAFAARFGAIAPVAPRILVTRTTGGTLRAAREALGRSIGELKNVVAPLGPDGILRALP